LEDVLLLKYIVKHCNKAFYTKGNAVLILHFLDKKTTKYSGNIKTIIGSILFGFRKPTPTLK